MSLLETALSNAAVVTIAVVLLIPFGWRCRSPYVRHAVWLLVLVKLFTPAIVAIPVTFSVADSSVADSPATRTLDTHTKASEIEIAAVDLLPLSGRQPARVAPVTSVPDAASPAGFLGTVRESAVWLSQFSPYLLPVWLAGSIGWFSLAVYRTLRFQKLLRESRGESVPIQAIASRLATRLGIRRCPTVLIISARISPMLWGIGRQTRILLPQELMEQLNSTERDAVLLHELAHFRRGDHLVRLFEAVCMTVFWWHPTIRIARRELQNAEEECCDAWVVSQLAGNVRPYADALMKAVEFTARKPSPSPVPPGASAISGASLLKRRVQSIMNGHDTTRLSWTGRTAILAIAVATLPFLPAFGHSEPETEPESPRPHQVPVTRPAETGPDTSPEAPEVGSEREAVDGKKTDPSKPAARLLVERVHVAGSKTAETFVRIHEKRLPFVEFTRKFDSLISTLEKDKSKRNLMTLRVAAHPSVPTGQIQQIISLAQSAGIRNFSIHALDTQKPKQVEAGKDTVLRLELLADTDGHLAGLILDGESLGRGQQAFEKLIQLLTADKRLQKHSGEGLAILVDRSLVYSEVQRAIDTVSKLKAADGVTPAISKLRFAVPPRVPDAEGSVTAVRQRAGGTYAEVSIGADDGLKNGQSLWAYRIDATSNARNYLGRIRIEATHPDLSVGRILPGRKMTPLRNGDRVCTRWPDGSSTKTASNPSPGVIVARIRFVDETRQVLWINRGTKDGIKKAAILKVRGKPDSHGKPGVPKGRVTITRVLADHLAEARIESEDADNPLAPGDVLVSD